MHKLFPFLLIIGILLCACSGQSTPISTATPIPSSTATSIPRLSLTKEIKLETQAETATLAWSPDGNLLAVASGSEITILNSDLEIQNVLKPEDDTLGVAWNLKQNIFATVNGFRNASITIWEWDGTENLIQSQQIQADTDQYGVSWSPDGKMLATLASDSKSVIQIWDANTFEKIHTFNLPYTKPRHTLQWSLDNSKVFGSGELNRQTIFFSINISDGTVNELASFPLSEAVLFSIDSTEQWLAIASSDGIVQIINMKTDNRLTRIKIVNQSVDIAWHPNGTTLAILDYQTTLQLWEFLK